MGVKINDIKLAKEVRKNHLLTFLEKDISFQKNSLSNKNKFSFFSEIAMLLQAGVDVKNCLDIMSTSTKQGAQNIYKTLGDLLIQGDPFSTALSKIHGMNAYDVHTIRVGEETGKLPLVAEEISKFYERKIELNRQMTSALIYPAFVLIVTFGVVFFMLYSVVPMFQDLFRSFGAELPLLTRKIIALSEWTQSYGVFILLAIGILLALLYSQRKQVWFRAMTSSLVLRSGPLGKLIKKIYLTRFCGSMKLLVEGDTPLDQALNLTSKMINFYPYEVSLQEIEKEVVTGKALNESMSSYPRLFDHKFVSLIKVSEEFNQLDKMFSKLSEQYQAEVDVHSKVLSKVLEPALMVFIAIIVGVILLSMYLPLFEISNVID